MAVRKANKCDIIFLNEVCSKNKDLLDMCYAMLISAIKVVTSMASDVDLILISITCHMQPPVSGRRIQGDECESENRSHRKRKEGNERRA